MGTISLRVDDVIVGLRADTAELGSALRTALLEHVVLLDHVPAHYSVRAGSRPSDQAAVRNFHVLYEGACLDRKTLDGWGPLRSVLDALSVHTRPGADEVALRAVALIDRDDTVMLLPSFVRPAAVSAERRLNARGYRLVHPGTVRISPDDGVLVIPSCQLHVDRTSFAQRWNVGPAAMPDPVPAGRYPLARWYLYEPRLASGSQSLPASATIRPATNAIIDLGGRSRADVWRSLAMLLTRLETVSAGDGDAGSLLDVATTSTST